MKGFIQNIEHTSVLNADFRKVLYTAKHCQLVLMSLKPGEEIGLETHALDQFFRIEAGSGQIIMNGVSTEIKNGFGIIVPSGTSHNLINTGKVDLKLYTIYSPPNHLDGVVHHTQSDAINDHEEFNGITTD